MSYDSESEIKFISGEGPSVSDRVLFNSFWQAGFECSTHVSKAGKRLDLVAATGHDRFADEDFVRTQGNGDTDRAGGLAVASDRDSARAI